MQRLFLFFIPFPKHTPVLAGWYVKMLFEELGKILNIHDPAMQGDVLDLQVTPAQKILGILHTLFMNVGGQRLPTLASEYRREVPCADTKTFGKNTGREIV